MGQIFSKAFSILFFIFFVYPPLLAQSPQVKGNAVYGIYVRVKLTPGVDPRQQAMIEAQRLAFQALLQQNSTLEEKASFARDLPLDDDLSNGVKDVAIQQEKITATQYQATLNLTFKPQSLEKWLKTEDKGVSPFVAQNEEGSLFPADLASSVNTSAKPLVSKKTLKARLHAFQDWLQIQYLLERLPHLDTVNILEFSQSHGKVEVEWRGEENMLETSLQNAGFVVTRAADQTWYIEKKLQDISQSP